ncbi:MAG: hypothetical protein ALECFALPRED_003572 [Alectoria fallacina]|uniref:tRNA dimethylallyltransferase n=1 Tax=Alectoria fallacina TaxID=1903189 RepID=A0A8H3FN67_9LECA|nr:MAG: hypothetical protein ALECFALPRED_003572 [Alectoria fallacina]
MSPAPPRPPLVAVVGATGTGKSQLAVALAQRYNGEILNGDALQMYDGLPITTNKLPLEEMKGIPHHLLGCVKLGEEPWTVKQFLKRATSIIEEIRSRGRLPIVVGGTHYYTQSLLFRDALVEEGESDDLTADAQREAWKLPDANAEEMLKQLQKVDPEMAMRWHPSDQRKIRRSLEIWLKTGKKASELYKQQRIQSKDPESDGWNRSARPNGSEDSARAHLRYDSLIFWIHAPSDVLNLRLEERVDSMVSHGLLEEVASMQSFLQDQEQQGDSIDQSRGIWVAIGFKEFLPYILDGSHREELRQKGIERTKIATRQYAKRQVRWIRLRLQRAVHAANLAHNMFLLDATDFSLWSDGVDAKAQDITAAFISGFALPKPDSLSDTAMKLLASPEEEAKSATYCEACDKTLMFHSQWINHLKSKGHRASKRPKIDWKTLYPKNNGY